MKTVSLFTKVYGKKRKLLLDSVKFDILEMIKELDVNIVQFKTDKRGHLIIRLDGQDSEFISNMLIKKYGPSTSFDKITEGQTFNGSLVDVGKVGYGIYVDIALLNNIRIDALVPLYKIRKQFGLDRALRLLASSLILVDNLPVEVKITNVDKNNQKIEAEFGQNTLARFEKWVHDDHERLLIFGANRDMLDNVLKQSGHLDDIYEIENLGVFEHALICKRSTRSSGILAAIGPRLQGVAMHLFIPKEIEAKLNA
ncbi:DUF2110 family protein [Candidatus Thorarchaeota archaeon]|nr:MAG: DUF2110 family protein [Candidatus Thorarchaeota archaeon]